MNADNPSLLSLVLTLQPQPPLGKCGVWWGRATHQAFLACLQARDAGLADRLHDESGLKPFTASSLYGRFPRGELALDQVYTLRYTTLGTDMCEHLLSAAQAGGALSVGSDLELDRQSFRVLSVAWQPDGHPWAAAQQFEDLLGAHSPLEPPPRRLGLRLLSPTTFHVSGKHVPFPLPELVFTSLLERWNSFAPAAFPPELKRYACECLAVGRFRLETRAVPFKEGGLRIGSQGEITYTALNYDRWWMGMLHSLTQFAAFSGVGSGVGAGMGQCWPVAVP